MIYFSLTFLKHEPPNPTEDFKNLFPILESDPIERLTYILITIFYFFFFKILYSLLVG